VTAVIYDIHTHAEGRDHGWWGDVVHPAHLDEKGKTVEGSSWRLHVTNQPTCVNAHRELVRAAQQALSAEEVFGHDRMQL